MIKPSKAYVLILVALMLPVLAFPATGAFAFSFPQGTVVAGPGLGCGGPTVFNTYSHDLTTVGSGVSADVAANVESDPSCGATAGWVPPLGPACPAIPGCGPLPSGFGVCGIPTFGASQFGAAPFAASQAANQVCGTQALEDNTFATSFYNAGGGPFSGLCDAALAGNSPQQFTLQFF
jgi:hypothetical protein